MKAPSPTDSVRAWVLRYLSSSSALARPRLLVEEYTWPEKKLDDEWPESIFHHVGSQSASYLLSVL